MFNINSMWWSVFTSISPSRWFWICNIFFKFFFSESDFWFCNFIQIYFLCKWRGFNSYISCRPLHSQEISDDIASALVFIDFTRRRSGINTFPNPHKKAEFSLERSEKKSCWCIFSHRGKIGFMSVPGWMDSVGNCSNKRKLLLKHVLISALWPWR